jgi:hypothetical protein
MSHPTIELRHDLIASTEAVRLLSRLRLVAWCLCLGVAFVGSGYSIGPANAQDNVSCGELFGRVAEEEDGRGNTHKFQIFRHFGGGETPVLPSDFSRSQCSRCAVHW